jgi:hypothetical protein
MNYKGQMDQTNIDRLAAVSTNFFRVRAKMCPSGQCFRVLP